MRIAAYEKCSLVDYPGQLAAVLFAPGCNYNCFFCHNRALLTPACPTVPEEEVFAFLQKRVGLLDGVVFTGGEPLLQPLEDTVRRVRDMGYSVKLDTNGSLPHRLAALLETELVDYVAMDLKAPAHRYPDICGAPFEPVAQSLDVLRQWGGAFELRTTFLPQLRVGDIADMLQAVGHIPAYALQQYRIPDAFRPEDVFRIQAKPHPPADFEQAAALAAPWADHIVLRI